MAAQKMTTPFGLLGRKLGHSWSRPIHEQLGSAPYSHVELEPDEVAGFIANEAWRGLNVTIPYKAQAAASADEKSPRVERLGVANTLVHRPDGTIYAENTDVLGFSWMLDRFCTRELAGPAAHVLDGKKALVLGSGGAAQAVVAALEDAGANVTVISRSGEDNYGNLLQKHSDAALIVNTTPVGMYPNCPASPLTDEQLGGMHRLLGVLDVVYNPRKTGICLAAERMGLPSESGLAMLVAQAFFASELFQGRELAHREDRARHRVADAEHRAHRHAGRRQDLHGQSALPRARAPLRRHRRRHRRGRGAHERTDHRSRGRERLPGR